LYAFRTVDYTAAQWQKGATDKDGAFEISGKLRCSFAHVFILQHRNYIQQ